MRIENVVPLFMIPLLVAAGPGAGQPRDAPPSTPQGLVALPYGPGAGQIRWQRSSDDRGAVIGYEIARDGIVLGVFDTLSRVDRGLEPGNVHRFSVTAIDSAGQRSGTARVMLSTHDALPLIPSGFRGDSAPARLWVHTGQGTTSPDAAVIVPGRVEATASLEPIDAVRTSNRCRPS